MTPGQMVLLWPLPGWLASQSDPAGYAGDHVAADPDHAVSIVGDPDSPVPAECGALAGNVGSAGPAGGQQPLRQ